MVKTRVMIICSDFRWYGESIKRGFENNNCEVVLCQSHINLHKKEYVKRMMAHLGWSMENDRTLKLSNFNSFVLEEFNRFEPDIIFSVLSIDLMRNTLLKLKEKSKLVLFLSDSIDFYPSSVNNVDLFDVVFSYELRDVGYLRKRNVNVYPLMGGYDEKQYFKIEDAVKDIEVSFVGTMYKERQEILERLIRDLPDVNFKFYGEYAPIRKPVRFVKWFFNKRHRHVFVNKNIPFSETNMIYNRSKIVLDIHCKQSESGWSSRLPEIASTGAFQIVDYNPVIQSEFGSDIITFSSYEELVNKIRYFLNNDEERQEIAIKTCNHVQNMTVTKYMEYVLDKVNAL